MFKFIKAHPVNFALTVLFVLASMLATIFLITGNSDLRKENREERKLREQSELREKRAYASFDSLMLSVAARDKEDSIRAIRDSQFVAKISELNKTITTLSANSKTISTLPVNEFLDLVTTYIDSAK